MTSDTKWVVVEHANDGGIDSVYGPFDSYDEAIEWSFENRGGPHGLVSRPLTDP